MRFLLDVQAEKLQARRAAFRDYVAGQLLTPLTKYARWGGAWAADNGAFSRFDASRFQRLLDRQRDARDDCLFIAVPDVVGSARRTLEVFDHWAPRLEGWPLALVLQDGIEDLAIPWRLIGTVFVGGTDDFKISKASADCIKAAQLLGKHVHVGRVNTIRRYRRFADAGADTCDGSGVSRFDWMLRRIADGATDDNEPLFSHPTPDAAPGRDEEE